MSHWRWRRTGSPPTLFRRRRWPAPRPTNSWPPMTCSVWAPVTRRAASSPPTRGRRRSPLSPARIRVSSPAIAWRSTAAWRWIDNWKGESAVETIDLAYVGRGLHEELVAHVADQEGYFEDEGVHVAVRDGVSWPAERLRRGAVIGLGRTLVSRLKDGIEWTAVSFSTDHPLFWFLGNAEVKSMADLRGRRVAVHGPSDPPGTFARIVLRKHGLDPDKDLECIVGHPGDYQMDLRRLRDGSIDAAYVGSTLSPEQVAAEEGFHVLAWVGDHFQIPTVGVVVDPTHIPLDSPALQALARANERALQLLVEKPSKAVDYVAWFLDRLTREEAQRYYEDYVGPSFVPGRTADLEIAQRSIDAVAAELGIAPVAAKAMYGLAGNSIASILATAFW